jgi:predicted nucleotidyltransferase
VGSSKEESALGAAVVRTLVRRIVERFSPEKVILFGSHARGDAGRDSDLDLLVLFSQVEDPRRRAAELYTLLSGTRLPKDIVVSTTARYERYKNVPNTIYWPAAREGKVLYERPA